MAQFPQTVPVKKAEVYVFRAPIDAPVRTSFGIMRSRPAVVVRLEDADGHYGWGEAWCNFPSCGAEHRGQLLADTILPHVLDREWQSPEELADAIRGKLRILRLQCDEPGPFDQTIAGVDNALWDLGARRAGVPLHALLGDAGMAEMPAYASGINHPGIADIIARSRSEGYRTFKIKIGFGDERDRENIHTALAALQPGERLAADVNQGWSMEKACRDLPALGKYPLLWIEEPIPCDSSVEDWNKIASISTIPLSAGENMRSMGEFKTAIDDKFIKVVQPDICKWGGLSKCRKVAFETLKRGLSYCPHYLGGGIGLVASAHLLAAAGGPGMLEVDCNPNPLRPLLASPFPKVAEGMLSLTEKPGIGVEPDLEGLRDMITYHRVVEG